MSLQTYKMGDRVRVTLEGEVTRILDIEPGSEEVELRIEVNGKSSFVYTDMARIEKVKPPVEVFGPGALVRHKTDGDRYLVGADGYCSLQSNKWFYWDSDVPANYFSSDEYELVEVG